MDRLQTLEVFIAVAEAESFTEGARRMGLSAPSVTRGVNALEDRLGVRLFTRTTRRVRLTDVGQSYLEDARHIVTQFQAADDAATGASTNPVGKLRLTCPNEFGRIHVAPILTEFLDTHTQVSADVAMLDRVVNMVEEGFDVAVRIGPLPSSGLIAVRVGSVRRVVCGAPSYFEQHGYPQRPADLLNHKIVSSAPASRKTEWRFGLDQSEVVRLKPRLHITSVAAAIAVARKGWGLTRVLSYQLGSELQAGQLQSVLDRFEPDPWPIHLVHTEGRRVPAKVRTFINFAAKRLRSLEALQ